MIGSIDTTENRLSEFKDIPVRERYYRFCRPHYTWNRWIQTLNCLSKKVVNIKAMNLRRASRAYLYRTVSLFVLGRDNKLVIAVKASLCSSSKKKATTSTIAFEYKAAVEIVATKILLAICLKFREFVDVSTFFKNESLNFASPEYHCINESVTLAIYHRCVRLYIFQKRMKLTYDVLFRKPL